MPPGPRRRIPDIGKLLKPKPKKGPAPKKSGSKVKMRSPERVAIGMRQIEDRRSEHKPANVRHKKRLFRKHVGPDYPTPESSLPLKKKARR